MYARTKGWELGEVTVAVDYDNRSTPRRFEVAIELGGDLSDEQLERLEKVARSCPLRRSIEAGIEFVETIERRERAAERALVDDRRCIVSKKQIVILGGGTGGTMTANRLRRRFDAGRGRDPRRRPRRPPRLPAGPALRPLRARARRRDRAAAPAPAARRRRLPRERGRVGLDRARRGAARRRHACSRTTCSSSPPACACSRRRPRA